MSQTETARGRGRLKIYLGYAAGSGKTYRMLEEAQHAKAEGADIVIGYFEPHARKDTIARTEGLALIPRRIIQYRGGSFEEMDTAAILQRAPAVCLVDEFAHTNVPGSERNKRWEDVLAILDSNIDVWTTMNLQHVESLNDQILQISGIRVRETVPDWVIKKADEIVMVDVTPHALINRLKRGVVYDKAKAEKALNNFFKERTLVSLRELALREAAHEVETRQMEKQSPDEVSATAPQSSPERILIHITADPATAMLIRRGHRVADYLRAECFGVYVCPGPTMMDIPVGEREAIERHLNFARNLRIETQILYGEEVPDRLVEFAHDHQVTQIFLVRSQMGRGQRWFGEDTNSRVLRLARDTQVIVVAERKQTGSFQARGPEAQWIR